MCVYTCIYAHAYIYIYMYVCMYMYIYIHICLLQSRHFGFYMPSFLDGASFLAIPKAGNA